MIDRAQQRKTLKPWTDAELAELDRLWEKYGGRIDLIAETLGRTVGSIAGKSMVRHLHFHGEPERPIPLNHPAMKGMRSVFHRGVRDPEPGVLKPGENQRKLGGLVTKGRWSGMPIYSLTLEERATCPKDCKVLASCYGNSMGRAVRYRHGPELERQLAVELGQLQASHPRGFVIRLHILGDFYTPEYVGFWDLMLDRHPALRVFGYTAWPPSSLIGAAVAALRDRCWDRFAVRSSGAAIGPRTLVLANLPQGRLTPVGQKMRANMLAKAGHPIICPAQTGGTACCATCGLCWHPLVKDRPIAFLRH